METVKLQVHQENKVKLSSEELDQLQKINEEANEITVSLGKIEIDKLVLENSRNTLLARLNELYKSQDTLAEELAKKYGDGTINMTSGEFTKTE
jgi:hypothetical protein